jgi:hypothetical protein
LIIKINKIKGVYVMYPQKINPNAPECNSYCEVLNNFITFISGLNIRESNKSDAIKVIECLKFIKVNLAFIAYAVEHPTDPKIYRYKKDRSKGVIRDFNGTAMHFNNYSSKELVIAGLENLVQQFESAVLAMREKGKLETFSYQLEYDKDIGCIEQRTAKALVFAATYLSSPSNNLDDLMGLCGFSADENNSESAFAKANNFLKPYLGQACIWKNNEYVLDEKLIKQYLTEIFDFNYTVSLSEEPTEEEPLNCSTLFAILKNRSVEERIDFIKKMDSSKLDDILKQDQGYLFLCTVLSNQHAQVCIELINKASSSALEQALDKLSASGLKEVFYNESSMIYLSLLRKINHINNVSLSLKTKLAIIAHEMVAAATPTIHKVLRVPIFLDPVSALVIGIKNSRLKLKVFSLTGFLENIFLYHSPEVLIEFIADLSIEQRKQIILPLDLPQIQNRLPYFLLSKDLHSESTDAFYNFLQEYQPLKDKLISHYNPLLANCINFYFEGKGEIAIELRSAFIEALKAKISLSKKANAFLEVLGDAIPSSSMSADRDIDPQIIWERGVLSWHHYRQLRIQQNNTQLQTVLDRLVSADLLFTGSPTPFADFFGCSIYSVNPIENVSVAAQRAFDCIKESKGLIKIIKSKDWQFFVDQLENLNDRPKLRDKIDSPTHKFVHLTEEIVPYQKKRRQKANYTHTKKTSTTLLSPQIATSVFGENFDTTRLLVGLLFDQKRCQVKAMLLKDSGTVRHTWLGKETDVSHYKFAIAKINQTDQDLFVKEVSHKAHHNEVLAKVNKEAMCAIVIARDTPEARCIAIERHSEIMKKFSIDLPIIFYTSSLQSLRHYTLSEQQDDKRAWKENQKVCSPREPKSKENVLTILDKALNKPDWQLGPLGSRAHINNKPVSQTVVYFSKIVDKASEAEKLESPNYTWVEAENNIKNILVKKTTENRFFKAVAGRSNDTVEFYKDLVKIVSKNM